MNIFLATAFGLDTHNLVSFQLTVCVHDLPKINAVYRVDNFDKITAIAKNFELHSAGVNKDVELPDAGDGLKEDTSLNDGVRHFCKA